MTIIHSRFASYLDMGSDCCSETELQPWLGYPSSTFYDSLSVRGQLRRASVTWNTEMRRVEGHVWLLHFHGRVSGNGRKKIEGGFLACRSCTVLITKTLKNSTTWLSQTFLHGYCVLYKQRISELDATWTSKPTSLHLSISSASHAGLATSVAGFCPP